MRRLAAHFYIVAAMLCCLSALTTVSVSAQGLAASRVKTEASLSRYDGHLRFAAEERQRTYSSTLQSGRSSQRIGASRPSRLLPTHGSRPGKDHGKYFGHSSFNPINNVFLRLSSAALPSRPVVASPRFYYVLALRRLLC